jgi:hypothetical protein
LANLVNAPLKSPFSVSCAQAEVTALEVNVFVHGRVHFAGTCPMTGKQAAKPTPRKRRTTKNGTKPRAAAGGHRAVQKADTSPTTVNVLLRWAMDAFIV